MTSADAGLPGKAKTGLTTPSSIVTVAKVVAELARLTVNTDPVVMHRVVLTFPGFHGNPTKVYDAFQVMLDDRLASVGNSQG